MNFNTILILLLIVFNLFCEDFENKSEKNENIKNLSLFERNLSGRYFMISTESLSNREIIEEINFYLEINIDSVYLEMSNTAHVFKVQKGRLECDELKKFCSIHDDALGSKILSIKILSEDEVKVTDSIKDTITEVDTVIYPVMPIGMVYTKDFKDSGYLE